MTYTDSREFALDADAADELKSFRGQFAMPPAIDGRDCVYMCGNSLGLRPQLAVDYIQQELDDWARYGVEGHFRAKRPWMPYHRNARKGLAYLTGALETEVVAMNQLTVNLHLMMATFYRPTAQRRKIVIESTAFPSDRFAVQSQVRLAGFDPAEDVIYWAPREDTEKLELDDLQAILDEQADEIALLLLPGVQYYNGQVIDMAAACDMARAAGCNIGLDLAHAVGNVELKLHDWAPDFAAWCSYKYLNSGPGGIAGAFVPEKHHGGDGTEQLLGWWSHEEATRLKMSPEFIAEQGADLWALSNPSVFSMAPLLASLEVFQQAGFDRLREKSRRLTGFLDFLLTSRFPGRISWITPPEARGAQISMTVVDPDKAPRAVLEQLEAQNVICDWREPNVIRVAPAPLYNSFADVYEFAERLGVALEAA